MISLPDCYTDAAAFLKSAVNVPMARVEGMAASLTRPRWRRWSVPSQSKSCAGETNRPRSATPQKRRCLQAPHPGACSYLLHAQQKPAILGPARLGRPSESRDPPRLPAPLPEEHRQEVQMSVDPTQI